MTERSSMVTAYWFRVPGLVLLGSGSVRVRDAESRLTRSHSVIDDSCRESLRHACEACTFDSLAETTEAFGDVLIGPTAMPIEKAIERRHGRFARSRMIRTVKSDASKPIETRDDRIRSQPRTQNRTQQNQTRNPEPEPVTKKAEGPLFQRLDSRPESAPVAREFRPHF